MSDKLRSALQNLVDVFPTDHDLVAAGWGKREVAHACDMYEQATAVLADQPCFCDKQGLGVPGVSCGDCPTRDYRMGT
jgi:hypothetical protein